MVLPRFVAVARGRLWSDSDVAESRDHFRYLVYSGLAVLTASRELALRAGSRQRVNSEAIGDKPLTRHWHERTSIELRVRKDLQDRVPVVRPKRKLIPKPGAQNS